MFHQMLMGEDVIQFFFFRKVSNKHAEDLAHLHDFFLVRNIPLNALKNLFQITRAFDQFLTAFESILQLFTRRQRWGGNRNVKIHSYI